MSLANSPKVVTDGLELNLDFGSSKKFTTGFGTGNLVTNPTYNSETWGTGFPANVITTSGILAPDGTNTAVRMTCYTTGSSNLRVTFTPFTPNGTSYYNCSFYARKISGTTSGAGFNTDLNDATPTINYTSSLVVGEWIFIECNGIPTSVSKGFIDLMSDVTTDFVIDFWGVKVESFDTYSPFPLKDTITGTIFNAYHAYYYDIGSKYMTFSRSAAAPKQGALVQATLSGKLTALNFLYSNHTMEVWIKINDVNPGAYDGTEGMSGIVQYVGYHAGLSYSATSLTYNIWNGVTTFPVCASWTLGTSGTQVIQGNWYQVVVVNRNGTFTPYLNGVQFGTGTTPVISPTGIGTTNVLSISGTTNQAPGASSYLYYSKMAISNLKMYSRDLTATEVLNNFNALRGRFSL